MNVDPSAFSEKRGQRRVGERSTVTRDTGCVSRIRDRGVLEYLAPEARYLVDGNPEFEGAQVNVI